MHKIENFQRCKKFKMKKSEKSNLSKNLSNYFSEYCDTSSIHGIQYLGERGRFAIEKILWFIVISLLSTACIFFIIKSYKKWEMSPVIVSFATTETPIWEIPFPAVTICPEIKTNPNVFNYTDVYIRKLILNENITEAEDRRFFNLGLICPGLFTFDLYYNQTKNFTVGTDFIDDIITLFDHTLIMELINTDWIGETVGESEYTNILTEAGVCVSFNLINPNNIFRDSTLYFDNTSESRGIKHWSLEHGYSQDAGDDVIPKRTFLSGMKGGVQFNIFINDSFLDYMCSDGVQGFKVMIHHPFELPDFSKYILLPLDEYVQIGIRPKMITVSESLRSYSAHARNCYFPEQRQLKYFYNYTQNNCMVECLTNYTHNKCKCLPFYLPRIPNIPICGLGSYECVEESKVGFGKIELQNKSLTKCDCLPSCASLEYEIDISQNNWNWRAMFLLLERMQGIMSNINLKKDHMSYLSIYYKELYFMTSIRSELYGYLDFFSNTGGLLGLFVGFSVTSAIEILYFLTLRLICNLKKFKNRIWTGNSEI